METRNMWLPHKHSKGFIFSYKGKKYEVISQTYSERPSSNFPLSHYYTLVKEVK